MILTISNNQFSNLNIQDVTDTFDLKITAKEFPSLKTSTDSLDLIKKIAF